MIKLCVLDLDGTLLDDGCLQESDCKDLIEIQNNGVTLMLATGRNRRDVAEYVRRLKLKEHQGIVAYSDGQYLYDFKDNMRWEFEHLSYTEDVQCVYKLYTGAAAVSLYSKETDYRMYRSAVSKEYIKNMVKKALFQTRAKSILSYKKYSIEDIDKIVFYAEAGELDVSKIRMDYNVIYANDKQRYELTHRNVNKARAVKEIAAKYHFTNDEIVVFGNDENDICLFEEYKNSFCMDDASAFTRSKAQNLISREDLVRVMYRLLEEST